MQTGNIHVTPLLLPPPKCNPNEEIYESKEWDGKGESPFVLDDGGCSLGVLYIVYSVTLALFTAHGLCSAIRAQGKRFILVVVVPLAMNMFRAQKSS